jgi:hypothetical protein
LTAVAIATPFLGLRTLYTMLGSFINNNSWNFVNGGTFAELLILSALPEFIMMIILNIGGLLSRDLAIERTKTSSSFRTTARIA